MTRTFFRSLPFLLLSLSCSPKPIFPETRTGPPLPLVKTAFRTLGSSKLEWADKSPRFLFLDGAIPGQVEWEFPSPGGDWEILVVEGELSPAVP